MKKHKIIILKTAKLLILAAISLISALSGCKTANPEETDNPLYGVRSVNFNK